MLKSLTVRNFAVIRELRVDLGAGLVVFTGETGAGKSILIEALGFLLGSRASPDWLRAGAARMEVEGVFSEPLPSALPAELRKDGLSLRRELDLSGRSRAFLNGEPVALAKLHQLGELLIDFHGQHEHQTLLKPALQLDLLDRYAGLDRRRSELAEAWHAHQKLVARREAMNLSEAERLRRLDLYRYQLAEIDELAPKEGEEEELEALLPRLKNAERLRVLAEELHQLLYSGEGSAEELLLKAERTADEMSRLDGDLKELSGSLGQARTLVQEASESARDYRSKVELDPERLDATLGRLDKLARLRRKYGPAMADVLAFRERARRETDALENAKEAEESLERELSTLRARLTRLCAEAHEERLEAGAKLAAKVTRELKDLGMPHARFTVAVEMEEGLFTPTGSDRVEFLIAPNPGEPLKPLRSTGSGGELSRTMLGIKTVLARADRVPILVFDEVDAGVGGVVGRAVGKKLATLSRSHQILCVTHLPQIACFADRHLRVRKDVRDGRTETLVESLREKDRLEEMARMLGGKEATPVSRKHAEELLAEAQKDLTPLS